MSNLLSFITSFGSSAELRSLNPEQLRERMEQQGLTEQQISVILSGDRNAIATMVKTSGDIVCCVLPDKPDDQEPDDEEEKDQKPQSLKAAV
ncbi:hypothetical protein EMM73_12840 [Rheinheimera sediminis]|uniref:hypothetical protein n=1 Tax=Rheinheimera sp. YQF-1 TaxID=2499626 RepID=UPI000FD795CA|nr:hypothetical protein [Rheinheimera sp. YQF-1]RVT45588.1 hypothetical protein EMM73_12840 [Rheinheimera sp. YQF-1]